MKKTIILLCIALTSCKSLYFSDLQPQNKNTNILPALEPLIDIRSLESAYSLGITSSYGYAYGTPKYGNYITGASISTSYLDKRVQDAIVLFDREVKGNIANPLGEKYGYITFKITSGGGRQGGWGWYTLSFVTFCIPNLFGMPVFNSQTTLEIEVEVLDSKKNAVGRYSAIGHSKVPVALWTGYSLYAARRKSNTEAIKMAMTEIKEKINADYNVLNKKLIESGVLTQ